jgi:ribonuclease H2 subunit C
VFNVHAAARPTSAHINTRAGIIARYADDRTLAVQPARLAPSSDYDSSEHEGEEEERERQKVGVLEGCAAFDELVVWGHDAVPAADDPFVKGVAEWIAFADAIHARPQTQDKPERATDEAHA